MKSVTEVTFVEVMDDKIVGALKWSSENRRDNATSLSSVNGESNVSGQWTKRPVECWRRQIIDRGALDAHRRSSG